MLDWVPTPSDVAAILRARAKDDFGNELGTFTDETRPTAGQVTDLTGLPASKIEGAIGAVPEALQPLARHVAALAVACRVELTFFPEQINTGRSPYAQLKASYDEEFKQLLQAVADIKDGGEVGDGDEVASPAYGFPDETWMVGLSSQL